MGRSRWHQCFKGRSHRHASGDEAPYPRVKGARNEENLYGVLSQGAFRGELELNDDARLKG